MNNTDFLKQSLIAHRGLHHGDGICPENSMIAFKEAMEKKYIIELDVHLTRDNEIIVFHDNNLKRMTGKDKQVKDCTIEELKQLSLKGGTQKIPRLSEVLSAVQGKVPIIIELKYDNEPGKLEKKLVKQLDHYQGQFAVKSFHPFIVKWFTKNRKNYIKGQLVTNKNTEKNIIKKILLNSIMLLNIISKPDFISCNIEMLPNKKIEKLRKRKLILGWVVRTKEEMEFTRKYCDNEICEYIIK